MSLSVPAVAVKYAVAPNPASLEAEIVTLLFSPFAIVIPLEVVGVNCNSSPVTFISSISTLLPCFTLTLFIEKATPFISSTNPFCVII